MKRIYSIALAFVIALSSVGCGTSSEVSSNTSDSSTEGVTETQQNTEATTVATDKTENEIINETQQSTENNSNTDNETDEQKNSFSMMYYLAITAEGIRTYKDNRLALEDIYTSLLNDINPSSIDETTQAHLQNLRDIIKSYMNISIKRDRLQFIYNQQKASAMREAVPNPIGILSMANSLDWKKLAISAVYTAVDSYNSYKSAGESADLEYIMSGWDLDDEERETIMKNRDRAFDYMVDMVQEYHLDGLKTLNEKSIEKYAEICAIDNASERIRRLRAEEDSYSLLGNYWLELADAYFETNYYSECLECVDTYKKLATGIYRKDSNYVQILPKVIVAAQECYDGEQYINKLTEYTDDIMNNTSTDDWSVRYFVSQIYLDLYTRSNDSGYLDKAYKIASDNVTVLLKNQRSINETYMNDVVEETVAEPDYKYMSDDEKKEKKKEYKEEQKRVKEYNKALKEKRNTELPSLYEPLVLNCELMFALAEQLNIDDREKTDIDIVNIPLHFFFTKLLCCLFQ